MLKSLVKTFGLIAGLALCGAAYAVGMGGINVSSALGEPLKAEIELVAVGKAEQGRLTARLASPEAFKGAGMDYPANLPKLKFQIETRANGESYLGLTSAQPVNEPFVSVLIELSWSSGKLLREYTFLLDPPEFRARQPEAAEVKPVLTKVEEPARPGAGAPQMRSTAPPDEKGFAETPPAPVPARKPAEAAPAVKAAEPTRTAEAANAASGTIKVKRGDTLSQIAFESKPSGVSLERMLLALYRANTDAFDGNNMNRLKTGKILRLPDQVELSKLSQVEAVKEFRAHVSDWNAYRQKLAAAGGAGTTQQAPKQEAAGKISTTIADKSAATKEAPKEVVKLSKGAAPGDKTAASGKGKAAEEEATAKGKALKESSERVAILEKNIKDMQKLIDLKSQPAAPDKPAQGKAAAPSETKPEAKPAAPVAASQPSTAAAAAASAVKPAKPAAPPKVAPPPPAPSLLDEPLLLAGGAAALLALGGLGIMLARRKKGGKAEKKIAPEPGKATEDVGSATGRIATPVAPSPETGDFTQVATAAPVAHAQPEDADPISEAELFLNFGRDAQAEEILKDALAKNPANNQVRLKLLPIYASRKDTNSFSVIARQIEASGDASAWAQAAEMGRGLEPGNPMYGGAGEPVAAAPSDRVKREPQPAAGLDFDLGFGTPEPPPGSGTAATLPDDEKPPEMTGIDFDLGAGEPPAAPPDYVSTLVLNPQDRKPAADSAETTVVNTPEDLRAAQQPPVDIDVAAAFSPAAAPEKTSLDDLVFDITASHPALSIADEDKTLAAPASGGDKIAAFTLDFPAEAAPAQPAAKEAADFDLGSISLNLEPPSSTPAAQAPASQVRDARWHDVATKLDLAKAYQEMGDNAGACEILEEVMAEGDEQQRAAAEAIRQQLLA